jgi:radical SAM-linked protein
LRFTSHRDFGRAFERALRRAGIPMAYSSGFSPHPRISYATASPTGAASEAEYLEIALAEVCVPDLVATELDRALPDGLDILAVVEAEGGSLADRLTGSQWRIDIDAVDPGLLRQAVDSFLAAETAVTERMTKNGLRSFDARESVIRLSADETSLDLVTRHQTPLVRPDDVLSAMVRITPEFTPGDPLITRLHQGVLDESGTIVEPF